MYRVRCICECHGWDVGGEGEMVYRTRFFAHAWRKTMEKANRRHVSIGGTVFRYDVIQVSDRVTP
jgi:hypothetical protein